ncbi:MAG TPA: protoporphyrinogen oxidase [Longimicrobiales bacterium]|nr:protoporphyrinogen oxidase [Longimicrobiales bacterium]
MIVIVGAGISGLTLAHHLSQRRLPFTVLEASARVGGVIRSERVEGHLLEWGPQRARLTRELSGLVDELGLRPRLLEARRGLPLFIHRDGRLCRVPLGPREFLTSDIVSRRARLRVLLEPFTRRASSDETVADYFTRKLGREAYESIAGPLYGGLYASDSADMIVGLSLGHVLRDFGVGRSLVLRLLRHGGRDASPPACSFEDGLAELPRALHALHRDRVRLEMPALVIRRSGRGWRVETGSDSIEATHVVVTGAARDAAALLRESAPDAAARMQTLVYNPLAIVHMHADTELRGLGYQVALGEDLITRGVTFNDSLFGRRGVYTAFLGGAKNPRVAREPDERLARIAVDEFRRVTGYEARALSVAKAWMPAWDRSWQSIEGLRLPDGLHVHANWESRPGIEGRLAGSRRLADRLAAGD